MWYDSVMNRAMTFTYVSIALIPAGALVGFLHGGLGLALMITGWIGVLWFDGPAHGQARFGRFLDPKLNQSQTPGA